MPPKRKGKLVRRSATRSGLLKAPRPHATIVRMVGGFPDTEEVTLRFTQRYTVTTSGSTPQYVVVSGNGMFDPDQYSSATQPNNWDDWAVQYTRYMPMSSTITLKLRDITPSVVATNTTPNNVAFVVAGPDIDDAKSTGLSAVGAESRPRYKSAYPSRVSQSVIKMSTGAMQLRGYTSAQMQGQETAQAATSANPTAGWFWNIIFASGNDTDPTTTICDVRIDYKVRFFQRISQGLDFFASRAASLIAGRPKPKSSAGIKVLGPQVGDTKTTQPEENKGETKRLSLSQEEAFEEWGDVDSDYAVFLEARAARKKAARRIATTDQSLVDEIKAASALTTYTKFPSSSAQTVPTAGSSPATSSTKSVADAGKQLGAGAKTSLKGTA